VCGLVSAHLFISSVTRRPRLLVLALIGRGWRWKTLQPQLRPELQMRGHGPGVLPKGRNAHTAPSLSIKEEEELVLWL
jgi:hypothetical protein